MVPHHPSSREKRLISEQVRRRDRNKKETERGEWEKGGKHTDLHVFQELSWHDINQSGMDERQKCRNENWQTDKEREKRYKYENRDCWPSHHRLPDKTQTTPRQLPDNSQTRLRYKSTIRQTMAHVTFTSQWTWWDDTCWPAVQQPWGRSCEAPELWAPPGSSPCHQAAAPVDDHNQKYLVTNVMWPENVCQKCHQHVTDVKCGQRTAVLCDKSRNTRTSCSGCLDVHTELATDRQSD